jgi:predicted RNA binding protein YcfA (HicA-like mRNA interferase family)
MNSYYPIVIAELKKLGFSFTRTAKGSHEMWCKNGRCTPVPFSLTSRHTANGILKFAGSSKKV